MQVLIWSDAPLNKDLDLIQFHQFAEPEDLHLCHTEIETKNFINKHLFKNQGHIDFIIIHRRKKGQMELLMQGQGEFDDSFIDWVRESTKEYSDNNFNFKSIPVIIFDSELFRRDNFVTSFTNTKYNLICNPNSFYFKNDRPLIEKINKSIYSWVLRIGDELDNLDLDLTFNFGLSRIAKIDTLGFEILSESFLKKQKSFEYLWTGKNIQLIEWTADELERMVKQSLSNSSLRNEKEIHRLILANDLLLRGENFSKTLYERHFYYPISRKYVEPDFINIPHRYSFSQAEIFEVKLPNQKLCNDRGLPSRYLRSSTNQVGLKYKDFFSDSKNENELMKRAALKMQELKYTLLIGCAQSKEENVNTIRQFEIKNKITILSFHDLMARYERLYQRLSRFRLN